jgi:hypothetical protein
MTPEVRNHDARDAFTRTRQHLVRCEPGQDHPTHAFKQDRNAKLSSGSGPFDDSRPLSRPDELRRARLAGAWPLPGSTSRDEAPRAILVQHEFWDGPNHFRITHQREANVVQDQPLPVHARCYGRMIFLLKDVSQDDDPNIFMGQACLQ